MSRKSEIQTKFVHKNGRFTIYHPYPFSVATKRQHEASQRTGKSGGHCYFSNVPCKQKLIHVRKEKNKTSISPKEMLLSVN